MTTTLDPPPLEVTWEQLRAAYPDKPIATLQALGIDRDDRALVCDGKVGPRTTGATFLNPAAVTSPVALIALGELLDAAQETLGNNRGHAISKYMGDKVPTAKQGPWCAGFATWCLRQAYPSAPRSLNARRSVAGLALQLRPDQARADDLIAWERKVDGVVSPAHGHVEIVVGVEYKVIWTIGGNVDRAPGVDGVGARRYSGSNGWRNRDGNACVGVGRHAERSATLLLPLALLLAQALAEAQGALPMVDLSATSATAGLVAFGAALYVLVEFIKAALGPVYTCSPTFGRVLPILAPLLGAILAPLLAYGWSVEGVPMPLLAHVLAGLVAGWMSGGLYSTLAQTLMGRDARTAKGVRDGE